MEIQKESLNLTGQQLTPLMSQYWEIKSQYLDSLIFFQVGDFYELFFQDAVTAAQELNITLTSRGNLADQPIALCGVPCHAADFYIIKLARAGFKVIICDQLEEAQQGKIVKRGITRVITPGTMTDSILLNEKKSSYLMILSTIKNNTENNLENNIECSLVIAELLTGLLWSTKLPLSNSLKYLQAELVRFTPDEIIIDENSKESSALINACKLAGYMATLVRKNGFDNQDESHQIGYLNWLKRFDNLEFIPALHTFYRYMYKYQPETLNQFKEINFYNIQDYLYLDAVTQKTLEITESLNNDKNSTLTSAIDETVTPMGSRLLKQWLIQPLKDLTKIKNRQEVIKFFYNHVYLKTELREILKKLPDFERIVGRCLIKKASYHDYQALQNGLIIIDKILNIFQNSNLDSSLNLPCLLAESISLIGNFEPLINFLKLAINENQIGSGFNLELDRLRQDVQIGLNKVLDFEQAEKLKTGINSLKIIYNQVHGYLIEITNTNLGSVPSYYEPYQKLSGRERFTVPELRALEQYITRAKRLVEALEKETFNNITQSVIDHARPLRLLAQAYAQLDLFSSLAHLAATRSYVCPEISSNDLFIKDGRHPVIEKINNQFIPNDLEFVADYRSLIITGPNMGGKSTYLRQSALIVILAHIGSFVPACLARIPLTDMICARIGTGDNLKEGKSTFLIEMEETAAICNIANQKTLVLLDEVGRGTSTEDGIAIARAVVEYLHEKKCMLMLATHYQELTNLEKQIDGIKNLHAVVDQSGHKIIFLHNIKPGAAKSSFGIEVAKISGMPEKIINRAYELLKS